MIASLPMYDRPETRADNDALWQGVRRRLGQGPERLDRETGLWEMWRSPDLLLSQTCGLPFSLELHNSVQLVASPDFALEGCPPGHYHSVIVARRDDPRPAAELLQARPVINERCSQSGHSALLAYAGKVTSGLARPAISGGHRASARMVAEGAADIAAIDANSWRMIARWDGFAASLHVLDRTAPTPAMPYITAQGRNAGALRAALAGAIEALSPEARDRLGLYGIAARDASDYLAVPRPPETHLP